MAAQSKLQTLTSFFSESSLRRLLTDLTNGYLQHRTKISRSVYLALFATLIYRVRGAVSEQKAASAREAQTRKKPETGRSDGGDATAKKKVELNREFFKSLFRLLKIVIPSWKSKELRLLVSHSIFLVLRTLISLYVAELDGRLVSDLVRGRGKEFLKGLVWWMIVAVPATFTNSMVGVPLDWQA
jgi:ATP-binding cassette, subfamily D (ALD), peroxisomal long-chain fatty acid import protein